MKQQHSDLHSDYPLSHRRDANPNDQNRKKQAQIYRKVSARRLDDLKLARDR
jgi:hypothetical protein